MSTSGLSDELRAMIEAAEAQQAAADAARQAEEDAKLARRRAKWAERSRELAGYLPEPVREYMVMGEIDEHDPQPLFDLGKMEIARLVIPGLAQMMVRVDHVGVIEYMTPFLGEVYDEPGEDLAIHWRYYSFGASQTTYTDLGQALAEAKLMYGYYAERLDALRQKRAAQQVEAEIEAAQEESEQYWSADYVMIAVDDAGVLQDAVNEILEEGYALFGHPFARGNDYCQALVLDRAFWRVKEDQTGIMRNRSSEGMEEIRNG